VSDPKLKQIFAEIEQQTLKTRDAHFRLNRISNLAFLAITFIFLFLVPEFLKPIGVEPPRVFRRLVSLSQAA